MAERWSDGGAAAVGVGAGGRAGSARGAGGGESRGSDCGRRKGIGDFDGAAAGLSCALIQEPSLAVEGVVAESFVGDWEGVDFLRGEPCGVGARTVDGERPRGDSGRRKGEARGELNDSGGTALEGVLGADWRVSMAAGQGHTTIVTSKFEDGSGNEER
jgi:hypothetical protein